MTASGGSIHSSGPLVSSHTLALVKFIIFCKHRDVAINCIHLIKVVVTKSGLKNIYFSVFYFADRTQFLEIRVPLNHNKGSVPIIKMEI